jgi:hypothetical protein
VTGAALNGDKREDCVGRANLLVSRAEAALGFHLKRHRHSPVGVSAASNVLGAISCAIKDVCRIAYRSLKGAAYTRLSLSEGVMA